jgi:anti-sigma B factor antagonist
VPPTSGVVGGERDTFTNPIFRRNDMEITVSHEQGRKPVTVLHVKGNIDTDSYGQLQARAEEAFKAGTRDLLIDLAGVAYISSAGLRALHHIFILLRTDTPEESDAAMSKGLRDGTFKSPHLKLLNPSPTVLQVIKTAGFDMFLEIHHHLNAAVASF